MPSPLVFEEANTAKVASLVSPFNNINKSSSSPAETDSLLSYHTAEGGDEFPRTPSTTSTPISNHPEQRTTIDLESRNYTFYDNMSFEEEEEDLMLDDDGDDDNDEMGEDTPLLFNSNYDAPPDYSDTRYREILDGEDLLPTYEQVQRENGHADWGERGSTGDSIFSFFTFFFVMFLIVYCVDKASNDLI